MLTKTFALICASALGLAVSTSASADAFDPNAGISCEGSTEEIQECLGATFDISNKELDSVYSSLRASLNKTYSDQKMDQRSITDAKEIDRRLVASQSAWIPFRDSDCSLDSADSLGGSGEGIASLHCLVDRTKERTKELSSRGY